MVIFMGDPRAEAWPDEHSGVGSFSGSRELAGNILERVKGIKDLASYREARLGPLDVLKNVLAIERYITQLYGDIKYNAAASSLAMCNGVAAEAFLVSLNCAPRFYRDAEGPEERSVDGDIAAFVRKMGDSMAMSEVDLDLGTGRWTTSTDLLTDMLTSLNVVSTSIIMGSENDNGANIAGQINVEHNAVTGCTLIAAYAMILYQCIKNGTYTGQVLEDIRR